MKEIAFEALPYLLTIIGFLIVNVLSGIKSEIREVKNSVVGLETDLRGGLANLDHRLTAIETRCRMEHGEL